MSTIETTMPTETSPTTKTTDFDVIVIGAGFGGLAALKELRGRGFNVRVIDAAPDVGGTWYWNRYPGLRVDSESRIFCYSTDTKLLEDWDWYERFPAQPEVLKYLRHVADRYDMRKDMDLSTRVNAARFDEETGRWTVFMEGKDSYTCQFLLGATGVLSIPMDPDIPGLDSFEGEWLLTARWPDEEPDFHGKRVAVIGTGATAVQLIPLVASVADELTVFQRTPNYVLPARNYPIDTLTRRSIKNNYDSLWDMVRRNPGGWAFPPAGRLFANTTDEERERVCEAAWEEGSMGLMVTTFDDLMTNNDANRFVSDFVRRKIKTQVKDPAVADILSPKIDNPIGVKRVPLGHQYYEAFNRDNVKLVDVSSNAIERIAPSGIVLADGSTHDVDVIIFALGYDAFTGALSKIDIRSTSGESINERWSGGAETYQSVAMHGFPNFFMVGGPQIPIANFVPTLEAVAVYLADTLSIMREKGIKSVEVTPESVDRYVQLMHDLTDATLFREGKRLRSWFQGANKEGKPNAPLLHYGGLPMFLQDLEKERAGGYPSYVFK
jgi:cation diffusion facilitator CzcD-associated flavoprotein CzcO